MSDKMSLKDVRDNAERLMDEGEYTSALTNWNYIEKNSKTFDPKVRYQMGKGYEHIDPQTGEAAKAYRSIIVFMSENKSKLDNRLFLESLFALGQVEKKRSNYRAALESFESFIDFEKKSSIRLEEETLEYVLSEIEKLTTLMDSKKGKSKAGSDQTPVYTTQGAKASKNKGKGRVYQKLKDVGKEEQREAIEEMWNEMNEHKMDIAEDSEWNVISMSWWSQWKEWSEFSPTRENSANTGEMIHDEHTSGANQAKEPGRIDNYDIIDASDVMLFQKQQLSLKDNLNEDQDYVIVSPKIWDYLYSIYDGTPIVRHAIKNLDSAEDANDTNVEGIIEVNMVKVYIFEVPRENRQDYYEVMLASRNMTLSEVKRSICSKKKIKVNDTRIWKMEKPPNLDKFYNELEYEWKKYKTLRVEGMLLKDMNVLMKDAEFSRDDFLMIEYQIPTTNDNGYALVEIEKKELGSKLNEKAAEALNDDKVQEAIANPESLKFLDLEIDMIADDHSVMGACGLSNLGNTGFMNSALQCMSNTTELTKYFLYHIHENEINHTNVLGSKGRVAEAYGELMHDMWIGSKKKAAPFNVKKSIGTVVAQFRGYNQQDSHEFLHYLIDTINEDLNRIKEKPYVEIPDSDGRDDSIVSLEQWEAFKKRNNSVMIDLFYGQLKSHLVCQVGEHVSNTFDPFSILSIPVPVVKIVKLKVTYFPRDIRQEGGVQNLEIHINDNLLLTELEKKIQQSLDTDNEMLFYAYDSSRIGKRLKKNSYLCRELVGTNIGAFAYKLDKQKTTNNLYIIDVYMKKQAKKMLFFSGEDTVGLPFVAIVDSKAAGREIQLQIFKYLYPLFNFPNNVKKKLLLCQSDEEKYETAFKMLYEDSNYGEENYYELQLVNQRDSSEGCPGCRKPHKSSGKFDFSQKSYKSFLNHCTTDPELMILWKMNSTTDLGLFESPEKRAIGEVSKSKKNKTLDFDKCMESFRQEELLDGDNKWYGGKCKEHVKAMKKMDIYKLPPVLIVQLKRFLKNDHEYSFFRNASRKITELVEFPIRELDMSEYIINDEEKKNNGIYDLYGVSNHMGKLHGGHYTASGYSETLKRWIYFDDASISKMSEKDVIDPAAYILFYRRRQDP